MYWHVYFAFDVLPFLIAIKHFHVAKSLSAVHSAISFTQGYPSSPNRCAPEFVHLFASLCIVNMRANSCRASCNLDW